MADKRNMRDIRNIYGIGVKKAEELRNLYNIKSVDSLRSHSKKIPGLLNRRQLAGLTYHSKTGMRIPIATAMKHAKYVLKLFKGTIKKLPIISVAGSIRREVPLIGDIDFVVIGDLEPFIDVLLKKKYVVEILQHGESKFSAICKLDDSYRIIDIVSTTPESYHFAMLYMTGSASENIIMRNAAKRLGYLLNQDGLYDAKSRKEITGLKSEEDIYNFLELEYREPRDRKRVLDKKSKKSE
jgi:DNA polymerase/3'-5' exonuclease PolX